MSDAGIADARRRGLLADEQLSAKYTRALDEVYRLRTALAVEADVLCDLLELKGLSARRKSYLTTQITRMRAASRGDHGSHRAISNESEKIAREGAGMNEFFVARHFEAEGTGR